MLAYQEKLLDQKFYRVKSEEEAITLANVTWFGLGSSIFSKDLDRAKKYARQIDSEWFS
jgi:succinate-semialdehyde dehydrogenase/glutarate-semialdehyde dehydrogenase